jgi:hypothetical protein
LPRIIRGSQQLEKGSRRSSSAVGPYQ